MLSQESEKLCAYEINKVFCRILKLLRLINNIILRFRREIKFIYSYLIMLYAVIKPR